MEAKALAAHALEKSNEFLESGFLPCNQVDRARKDR
jgi:hypothetical protein